MSEEIKPCPLCQSDNVGVVSSAAFRVKCFACYTSGSFGDRAEAIKAWNTRATPTFTQEDALKAYQAAADWVSENFPEGGEEYPHYPMIRAALNAVGRVEE